MATEGDTATMDPAAVVRSRPYLTALLLRRPWACPSPPSPTASWRSSRRSRSSCSSTCPTRCSTAGRPPGGRCPGWSLCGLLTGLTIRYLPGTGGHSPAFGFHAGGGPPTPKELPGVILAAFTTLSLGAVLGPEAPLIAIGGGLAALTVHLTKKDAPPMALTIMASAGSFAAISTLLGSPLLAAFLIMEAAGIGGATLTLVALPGLLASGVGALVFVGMNSWTGLGSFSLALTSVPPATDPTVATMLWALPIGAPARCSAGSSAGSACRCDRWCTSTGCW